VIFSPLSSHVSPSLPVELLLCLPHPLQVADPEFPESVVCDATTTDPRFTAVRKFEFGNQSPAGLAKYKFMAMELVGGNTSNKVRARWVALRARWGTLRARWVTLRARWVTLRARWATFAQVGWMTSKFKDPAEGWACGLVSNQQYNAWWIDPAAPVNLDSLDIRVTDLGPGETVRLSFNYSEYRDHYEVRQEGGMRVVD
jgi:hypothetical protein